MGWGDDDDRNDWREAKRQREEEEYDRWHAEREAERDADVGRYSRPSYSQEAYDAYDTTWNERDSYNRSRAASNNRRDDDDDDRNDWRPERKSFDGDNEGRYSGGAYAGRAATTTSSITS